MPKHDLLTPLRLSCDYEKEASSNYTLIRSNNIQHMYILFYFLLHATFHFILHLCCLNALQVITLKVSMVLVIGFYLFKVRSFSVSQFVNQMRLKVKRCFLPLQIRLCNSQCCVSKVSQNVKKILLKISGHLGPRNRFFDFVVRDLT